MQYSFTGLHGGGATVEIVEQLDQHVWLQTVPSCSITRQISTCTIGISERQVVYLILNITPSICLLLLSPQLQIYGLILLLKQTLNTHTHTQTKNRSFSPPRSFLSLPKISLSFYQFIDIVIACNHDIQFQPHIQCDKIQWQLDSCRFMPLSKDEFVREES